MRAVLLLFVLDTILTLEAAYVADIVAIAILHIITVPAFIALIYVDLIQHHKSQFRCFLCNEEIREEQNIEPVKRIFLGRPTEVYVHVECIKPGDRKAISERAFKRGIPK
jgi:hypothetical protein